MDKEVIESLINSKLFQGLSSREIETICSFAAITEKEYSKNQIILNQGEPVSKIGIIKNGTIISTKFHFNGNTQILRIYSQGEVFSLDTVNTTLLTSPSTLISQTDSTVIYLPYAKIIEADSIPAEVKRIIMSNGSEILSNELIRLMYKIDVLSKRTLRERIMTYLSLIRERTGSATFDLGMNQEQFAQYLCVNRSVLSNELNKMRESGLIDYKGSRYTIY